MGRERKNKRSKRGRYNVASRLLLASLWESTHRTLCGVASCDIPSRITVLVLRNRSQTSNRKEGRSSQTENILLPITCDALLPCTSLRIFPERATHYPRHHLVLPDLRGERIGVNLTKGRRQGKPSRWSWEHNSSAAQKSDSLKIKGVSPLLFPSPSSLHMMRTISTQADRSRNTN